MRGVMRAEVNKQVDRDRVYYTVFWSALAKPDRHEIISKVPSVAGIFELYYLDEHKQLNLFHVAKAWYGGLRNAIRKATDPELEQNPRRRELLEKFDCYYRYTAVDSYADMSDIFYFFAATYFPDGHAAVSSGRYEDIFVNEESPDKIVDVR
jgi:hypothetical protein